MNMDWKLSLGVVIAIVVIGLIIRIAIRVYVQRQSSNPTNKTTSDYVAKASETSLKNTLKSIKAATGGTDGRIISPSS